MKGEEHAHVLTHDLIKADRLTPGYLAPFNQGLRTALAGVLANGFIKGQNYYALKFYYPYKTRLAQETSIVTCRVGKNEKQIAWKDVSDGHRDSAAKRYMIKEFLKDLYANWRMLEGLEVRAPYQQEYLGHTPSNPGVCPAVIEDTLSWSDNIDPEYLPSTEKTIREPHPVKNKSKKK